MTTLTTTPRESKSSLGTIGLLAAAPLFGLGYIVLLPIVGIAALVWTLGKLVLRSEPAVKSLKLVGFAVAAPLIGLVYVLAFPIAGLATLAVIEVRGAAHAA